MRGFEIVKKALQTRFPSLPPVSHASSCTGRQLQSIGGPASSWRIHPGRNQRRLFSTSSIRDETSRRIARTAKKTRTRQKATLAEPVKEAPRRAAFWEILQATLKKPRTVPIPRWITPRHQTITFSEVLGHSSFVLVAVSYAVDDYLLLRCIAVAGSTAMLFFAYFHPHGRPLWLPFKWNVLFIAINSYRVGKVFLDRYFAERLSEEFLRLRNKNFYLMDPADFARLVRLGHVTEYKKGDPVVAQGESNRFVRLVLDGKLKVLRDGKIAYVLEEANFISEAGLHAGLMLPGKIESCCTIVAECPTRLLTWDRSELVALMARDSGVRRSIKAVLSWDIVRKLKAQRTLLASGAISDPEEWTERRNQQTQHRYTAILHNILSRPEYLENRRPELNKYRMIHHIEDEHHRMALQAIGWTEEEFRDGHRANTEMDDEEEIDEVIKDWKWYVQDIYLRVFG